MWLSPKKDVAQGLRAGIDCENKTKSGKRNENTAEFSIDHKLY